MLGVAIANKIGASSGGLLGGGPAAGSSWAELFTAMSAPPGVAYPLGDATQMSTSRTGGAWGVASSDPIGYVVDQARGGTAALGPDLVTNGMFDTDLSGWSASGFTWVSGSAQSPAGNGSLSQSTPAIVGKAYEITLTVSAASGGTQLACNLLGTTVTIAASASPQTRIVVATTSIVNFTSYSSPSSFRGSVDNISVRELPGLHAAATSDTRRPIYGSFDGGAAMAAQFNGTAHCLQTVGTLDLTSTDEVHVFAAVRSLADGVFQFIAETSVLADANNGAFALYRRSGNQYVGISRGTAASFAQSVVAPVQPESALILASAKISADALELMRNGASIITSAADQGAGNYGNHLLNIGARNAASPVYGFNGRIANLAIIGGPMTPEQIAVATDLASAGLTFSP